MVAGWLGGTYTLVLVALDNGEGPWVRDALHDVPVQSLLVVAVDARRLDQLGLELLDGLGVLVGVQVHGDCVDHLCGEGEEAWLSGN